ncbi:MAG: hypothetical protein AAGE18_16390 [Pseudomonadota bacterium]
MLLSLLLSAGPAAALEPFADAVARGAGESHFYQRCAALYQAAVELRGTLGLTPDVVGQYERAVQLSLIEAENRLVFTGQGGSIAEIREQIRQGVAALVPDFRAAYERSPDAVPDELALDIDFCQTHVGSLE